MGNRAVITFSSHPSDEEAVGLYLHWNGGIESVQAFLDVCRERHYRDPTLDERYAMARLVGLVCEYFEGAESVGVGLMSGLHCDNWDNGVYVVGKDWRIVQRWGEGSEQVFEVPQELLGRYADIVARLGSGK